MINDIGREVLPALESTERTVLGSMLQSTEVAREGIGLLTGDAFYAGSHKAIFGAIAALVEEEAEIDITTVEERLLTQGRLVDAGSVGYLMELITVPASTPRVVPYVKALIDYQVRRETITRMSRIVNNCYVPESPVENILAGIEGVSDYLAQAADAAEIDYQRRGMIVRASSLKPRVQQWYKEGSRNFGIHCGWPTLNKHYRPAKGMLNIITGIPGHGKSEFTDAMMVNTTHTANWKWAVFSPENYPAEIHIQKLAEKIVGYPFFGGARMDEKTLSDAVDWIDEHFYFIYPSEDSITLDAVLRLIKHAIDEHKIDAFLIDPWNELEMSLKSTEKETDWIGRYLSKIRRFGRRHNVAQYIVAHPKMMRKEKGEKFYRPPTLYDISGSAHWYNKADNAMCVYRDMGSDLVTVYVQKIKQKIHGSPGTVDFRYVFNSGRYLDIEYEKAKKRDESQPSLFKD